MYTARLRQKTLLSESAQCYHLEFEVPELEQFSFEAGQFLSTIAIDGHGKQRTRAYSIASAPCGNRFDLCVDRVHAGFFSNHLSRLMPGETMQFNGPHGFFVLHTPPVDTLLIAAGTGIAPMRGFVEHLFPSEAADRSQGAHFWLLHEARHESELYYARYFEKTAPEHPNFHYLPTVTHPSKDWEGLRGHVQTHARRLLQEHPTILARNNDAAPMHAYICGLNEMVAVNRQLLKDLGWDSRRIHCERYD